MPVHTLERPEFYEGQYLGASDLNLAVDYARRAAARHALGAHTWGIAIGLGLLEKPSPSGQVDVYVTPGYAWDGFGRPIVVLAPVPIPTDLFKRYAGKDAVTVPIWLHYDEQASQAPRRGFESCTGVDALARVRETFRLETGAQPYGLDRPSTLSVAGYAVEDASTALQAVAADAALVYDTSIPHQLLPTEGEPARWPIFLGYVSWQPGSASGQPGHFKPAEEKDKTESRQHRRYVGVVAEGIHAADRIIRLRRRSDNPEIKPEKPWSEDLVWVEGTLRVEDALKLFGGDLEFRDPSGEDGGVPLHMRRDDSGGSRSGVDLRVVIGKTDTGDNRLAVGVEGDKGFAPKFVVCDNGTVNYGPKGDLFPLAALQNLRVVAGRVNADGTKESWKNDVSYTSKRSSNTPGSYQVDFKTQFDGIPVVIATPISSPGADNIVTIKEITKAGFVAYTTDVERGGTTGRPQDTEFCFIALGPP